MVKSSNGKLSTIGAKLAAIKLDPFQYLSGFREAQLLTEAGMLLAEKYLGSV